MKKLVATMVCCAMLLIPAGISAGENYIMICEKVGANYHISPELLEAVIETESGGNPNLVGRDNDTGLMQIIPKWHKNRMEELGVTDLKDPYQNVCVGADYLLELFEKYEDPYLVLMCYNQGDNSRTVAQWEKGNYSDYSKKIVERAYELETEHGKHDYQKTNSK